MENFMTENIYECPKCHRRITATFETPSCCTGYAMVTITGKPLHVYECPKCHRRAESALGNLFCSCSGFGMVKIR